MKKKNKNELYQDNGYLNFEYIYNLPTPFIFTTGGRGIGKSWNALKYLIEHGINTLYLRRTQDEVLLQEIPKLSEIIKVNNGINVDYEVEKLYKKKVLSFNYSNCYIICISLYAFSNIRGFSGDNIECILYDEFVPEIHVRKLKEEGLALSNVYETIARNRELEGKDPPKLIGLSNSLNINNDIFRTFNLIPAAEELMETGKEIYIAPGNTKALIMPQKSPISQRKAETALYKATSEEYAKMALKNEFIQNDFSRVKKIKNLNSYKCVLQVGPLYVYRHKSNPEYYVTGHGTTKKIYKDSMAELERFRRVENRLLWQYYMDKITFDSYNSMALFEKYFNL